jgi:phenylpropionate dioxygenase-like ring-hydroxylating dioxygenase large terminal subunit
MTEITSEEIRRLVEPNRVHQRVYADPAIFELELARIFERTWVYAAHESEIRAPGDYVCVQIGRRDLIVARTKSGGIAAFHNRCAHRGAMVVAQSCGNAKNFVCPYHGWSYDTEGKLTSVPLPKSYPAGFVEDPQRRLEPVARIASYRGFIFISFSPNVPELTTYLAPIHDSIDNLVDRSPDRELIKEPGEIRQISRSNWKLHIENTFDNIHTYFVHYSSWGTLREWERSTKITKQDQLVQMIQANGWPLNDWEKSEIRGCDYGHAINGAYFTDTKIAIDRPEPWFAAYKQMLQTRDGKERAEHIIGLDRFNTLIYPNLIINNRFQYARVFQPLAVDKTMVRAFCFRLGGAPDEMYHVAVRFLTALSSPASMVSQDDHEIFNRIQHALINRGQYTYAPAEWIDFSRGQGSEKRLPDGSLDGMSGVSEVALRGQFAAWVGHMSAENINA